MDKVTSLIGAFLMTLATLVAHATGDTKATELLAQARKALGGEQALAGVQGLSCSGTVQRLFGDRQISGDLSIDLQLPDRMLRTDSISPMGDGALIVTDQGVNGDKLLRHTKTVNAPPGLFIRTPPAPAPGSDAETQALRRSRAELARFALAMVLATPASLPLEFEYAGEAEAPDGKADVLTVKGPSSFAAQLFLDKTTHRPLMLSYKGVAPQTRIITRTSDGPRPDAGRGASASAEGAAAALPPPQVVDINMFLDDYRSVDGVLIPHHVTHATDGQTNEEWTFKTIKVNPAFKADAFTVK